MEVNEKLQASAEALLAVLPNRSFKLKDAFTASSKAKLGLTYETTKNRLRILREQGFITTLPKSYYIKNDCAPRVNVNTQSLPPSNPVKLSIEELKEQAALHGLIICRKIVKYEIL